MGYARAKGGPLKKTPLTIQDHYEIGETLGLAYVQIAYLLGELATRFPKSHRAISNLKKGLRELLSLRCMLDELFRLESPSHLFDTKVYYPGHKATPLQKVSVASIAEQLGGKVREELCTVIDKLHEAMPNISPIVKLSEMSRDRLDWAIGVIEPEEYLE
jgi:hypothetical protein